MPISHISAPDYHAIKAVSAGMVWTMDSECPLKAFLASPWNPDQEPEEHAPHLDIGTAAHLAVLEEHLLMDRAAVHAYPDYRTKEAKAFRDDAYETGKIPLKAEEWATVTGIQKAIARHPIAQKLFTGGKAEVSLTWEWNGIPCKCRPDYLGDEYVVDLKTAISAHPGAISRKALLEGWHARASWYLPGVREVTGELPEKYLFVVVEKSPPHIVEVYELDIKALIYGEQIIGRSMRRIAWCLKTGDWPSYGEGGVTELSLPGWSDFERAKREEAGEFDL